MRSAFVVLLGAALHGVDSTGDVASSTPYKPSFFAAAFPTAAMWCDHPEVTPFMSSPGAALQWFQDYFPPEWMTTNIVATQPEPVAGFNLLTGYPIGSERKPLAGVPTRPPETLMLERCRSTRVDGTWFTDRAGPFESTGGNDWWALSWGDVGQIWTVFGDESYWPDSQIYVTAHFAAAVDAAGSPIPLPPIHEHHNRVTQCNEPRKCGYARDWYPFGDQGTLANTLGDFECDDCDALRGLGEDYGSFGIGKPLFVPHIGTNALINDVRPLSSPVLTWYYQAFVRIRNFTDATAPAAAPAPLSMHVVSVAGVGFLGLFRVLPDEESFIFAKASMAPVTSGSIISVRTHLHSLYFESGIIFAGTLDELELPSYTSFFTQGAWPEVDQSTKAYGFASNAAMEEYVMAKYQKNHVGAQFYCKATGQLVTINDGLYDRRAEVRCSGELTQATSAGRMGLHFNASMPIVVFFFFKPPPPEEQLAGGFPMHAQFQFFYVADDQDSYQETYVLGYYDGAPYEYGMPTPPNLAWKLFVYDLLLSLLPILTAPPELLLPGLAAVLLLTCWCCAKCCCGCCCCKRFQVLI